MFNGASKLTNIGDLSEWDTGNVTNMGHMFYNASSLTNIGNLDNWNTGNVQYMDNMFNGASGLTTKSLSVIPKIVSLPITFSLLSSSTK